MNKLAVFQLLEENKNERGISNWKKLGYENLESFGIGLTLLKKLSKKVGKNHELALELWLENNYDIKVISILIDEPKKVAVTQIEAMVSSINMGMLTHIWVQNLFSKVSFAKELAEEWREEQNKVKRRCGYSFLYYFSKDKKISDVYFYPTLNL